MIEKLTHYFSPTSGNGPLQEVVADKMLRAIHLNCDLNNKGAYVKKYYVAQIRLRNVIYIYQDNAEPKGRYIPLHELKSYKTK